MSNIRPKILIISSCRLSQGPAAIAKQYYDAFCQHGYETDLLLKYPEAGHPEYKYVVKDNYERSFFTRLRNRYYRFRSRKWKIVDYQYLIFYTKEIYPPTPSKLVVNKIETEYDLVLIVFWQGLLSFETIQKIYDKLRCQIHFIGVDYSQMSGGCHFTGSCNRYMTGCGECPALQHRDKNDFTAWNIQYRKEFYAKVKPIVYGNHYMQQFYKKSLLLKDANCEILPSAIIDTEIFKPMDPNEFRTKYHIPLDKKHVLMFGSQYLNNPRKGVSYLLEAFSILKQRMKDRSNDIIVVIVGKGCDEIKERIALDAISIEYVEMNRLPEIYAISSCFICPSIDDAGPMMVNQSLCCGIPVVGFEMGAVLEVVKDKGTGICVPLKDSQKLADGIYQIITMKSEDFLAMRKRCREVALRTSSYKAQTDRIISTFAKYTHES